MLPINSLFQVGKPATDEDVTMPIKFGTRGAVAFFPLITAVLQGLFLANSATAQTAQSAQTSQSAPESASQGNPGSGSPVSSPATDGTDSPVPWAENAALKARVKRLEEEQRAMRALFEKLSNQSGQSNGGSLWMDGAPPEQPTEPKDVIPVQPAAPTGVIPTLESVVERLGTRYDNGFVLVESPDKSRVPYELRFNLFNQFRYLNQQLESSTFTDHLGDVHPVMSRNDLNVNRNLFYFQGYVFDPNLIFNAIIWSSNSVATVIQGGYIGYRFDKAFTLYAGYWGIPGSRTNTRDFMFLEGVERSMADNFFRPSFTQGVWAEGQVFEHLYYEAYIGNSLNTLNVSTTKIDRNMVYSGSTWWEPLGDYGPPGAARMAFSDLENHECPVVRIGTSVSGAREDRFSDLEQNTPENSAVYNSDGVLFFATGSLAPGVTVDLANYYMWAQDFGYKYRGFAFNAQYYFRWLNSFRADGPLPLSQTFDHGFEASAGYFIVPQTFETYGRTSAVFGQFGDSSEYALGFNWHPWKNRGFRLTGEANYVDKSPTNSVQTIYNSGMTGWNFVLQTQLYF
jgi:hypothetical protein